MKGTARVVAIIKAEIAIDADEEGFTLMPLPLTAGDVKVAVAVEVTEGSKPESASDQDDVALAVSDCVAEMFEEFTHKRNRCADKTIKAGGANAPVASA